MAQYNQQHLADLEELSLRIPNQLEQQYFAEAVQCYFNGALRAAIILGWVVATDNLLNKLEILGREDGEAKTKWEAIMPSHTDRHILSVAAIRILFFHRVRATVLRPPDGRPTRTSSDALLC